MTELEYLADGLHSRYGTVKRARGSFLYTSRGVRVTDLFQENGKAILGWGGGNSFTQLKNVLNRGITGSYVTDFDYRLKKAVCTLFNSERNVFVFYDKASALSAALSLSKESTSVWRPWMGESSVDWACVDCIIMEPPLPWSQGIYILASRESIAPSVQFAHVRLPAPLAAAVTRSVYDLILALQVRSEKDWFIWDSTLCAYWERRGPYLYPRPEVVPKESYGAFMLHCLDCAVAVNPVYEKPSIVPFGADRGIFSALKKNPFKA